MFANKGFYALEKSSKKSKHQLFRRQKKGNFDFKFPMTSLDICMLKIVDYKRRRGINNLF